MNRIFNALRSTVLGTICGLSVTSLIMLPLATGMVVTTSGCTISAATIKADGQAVATACQGIAAQLAVTNPQLAADLITAANGLLAVTGNWQTGSAIAVFNDAASAVEIALAAIPMTSIYAPLVAIAVAAVDILIANINPAGSPMAVNASARTNALIHYKQVGQQAIKHRFLRSQAGDIKAAWDAAVTVNHLQPSLLLK